MLSEGMAEDLIKGLCDIFGEKLQRIVLYGSVARNESGPESDIDIAVIVKEPPTKESRDGFLNLATDLDMRYERVFSIIDIEQKSLEKWGRVLPFYKNIQKEGVVLWKAV